MADEVQPAPPPPMVDAIATELGVTQQLTQVRVPLFDAAEALSTPDASGRPPILVLPEHALRIRNELVAGGVISLGVALLFDLPIALRTALAAVGVALLVVGALRSIFVSFPEGSRAVLLRSGRYYRTLDAGSRIVPPWIVISHIVTTRETPFEVSVVEVPTKDDVRINLHVMLTFRIAEPELFVFRITVPDFDHVCQASAQDAVRLMIRSRTSEQALDLGPADAARLRDDIGASLAAYGAEVVRVVVTHVRPPEDFAQSREAARLAAVQRVEEHELHALEMLKLADRDEQERERIRLRRAAIELEADNEAARLERLESRIQEFPSAMHWDVDGRRLDVAEALATNTRAMVQVGPGVDVAASLLMPSGGDAAVGDPDWQARPAGEGRRAGSTPRPAAGASADEPRKTPPARSNRAGA